MISFIPFLWFQVLADKKNSSLFQFKEKLLRKDRKKTEEGKKIIKLIIIKLL